MLEGLTILSSQNITRINFQKAKVLMLMIFPLLLFI